MSSPIAAPTPTAQGTEASKRPITRPTTAAPTDPSTPAHHATPSSNGFTSTFITPSASRVAGKTIGKTTSGKHPPSSAMGISTPNFGNVAVNFDSPSMLAMEPGGSSMGISLSALGLSGSGLSNSHMGRLDDTERRRRLENVLTTLGYTSGRVSQEGVQRLARKLGMEMYTESTDTHDLMTLAGNAYAVDLRFRPNGSSIVDNVELHFHGLSDSVMARAPDAARIMHEQLSSNADIPTPNVMLDRFAENLERLQRLDKLSIAGSSCFDAIAGVYTSLERLYNYEQKIVEEQAGSRPTTRAETAASSVMCRNSGHPRMHANGRVGLSLDYWRHRNRLFDESKKSQRRSSGDMEVDAPSTSKVQDDTRDGIHDVHSLLLECEYSSPALYPPIRVFNDWLSSKITTSPTPTPDEPTDEVIADPSSQASQELDWLDPPPLPIKTLESDLIAPSNDTESTHPRARFVATLKPPLVLPASTAMQIYASVGVDISNEISQPQTQPHQQQQQQQQQTYDSLLLGRNIDRPAQYQRSATTFDDDEDSQSKPKTHAWQTRLYVSRPELGREIKSIPFAHPRQLLPILPVLRQYALFETLLRSVAGAEAGSSRDENNTHHHQQHQHHQQQHHPHQAPSLQNSNPTPAKSPPNPRDELAALLDDSRHGSSMSTTNPPRILDVTLVQASPVPRLSVVIPAAEGPRVFGVEVEADGEVVVRGVDGVDGSGSAGASVSVSATANSAGEGNDGDEGLKIEEKSEVPSGGGDDASQKGSSTADGEDAARRLRVGKGLTEALAVCEDLVLWAEWARGRSLGGQGVGGRD